ncbi:hypothetical protein ATANTOWER_015686 [Ataeniobius toweri]|uniref:Uncharacterized protein n=1 Tax=Ataeniobius toweri TaxID=208326 RepID=A0ABU7BQA9_9TELE|nr:hypothetical protein [Ataeniobius toweri]
MQLPPTCAPHHQSTFFRQSWIRAPKDLPSHNCSCVVLSHPASLIPLVVHLPPPIGDLPVQDLKPMSLP